MPRGRDLEIANRAADVPVTVLADGHRLAELRHGDCVRVRVGSERSLLATLPEATFFRRYRETFAS